jgi:FKBP-type peptidyl-prolyl cis-trans isomerase FklB
MIKTKLLSRTKFVIVLLILTCSISSSQEVTNNNNDKIIRGSHLSTFMDSVSYCYGMDIAKYFKNMKNLDISINNDLLISGFNDYNGKSKINIDTNIIKNILDAFVELINQKNDKNDRKEWILESKRNLEYGKILFENNKRIPEIKCTQSGIQYKIITDGRGKLHALNDTIKVNIVGKTMYDIEFINNKKYNKPLKLLINSQVEGLKEILQIMPEGSKWIIYIPPNLAYGEKGKGKTITPNNVLIFELEIIEIN